MRTALATDRGVAGFFQPFDETQGKALPIWEIPLVIMEGNLVEQYQDEAVGAFTRMLRHVSKVGGALSVSFIPACIAILNFPRQRAFTSFACGHCQGKGGGHFLP